MYAHTGKVVWFNKAMGFGFLSSGDVGDVFVHEAAIEAADRMLRDKGGRSAADLAGSLHRDGLTGSAWAGA